MPQQADNTVTTIPDVQIAFVLACTQPASVSACASKIAAVVDAVMHKGALGVDLDKVQLALVGAEQEKQVFQSCSEIDRLLHRNPDGGLHVTPDNTRDISSLIHSAERLAWTAPTKLVVLFCDTAIVDDEHLEGSAFVMTCLGKKGVNVHFVELNESTASMMDVFYRSYSSSESSRFFMLTLEQEPSLFLPFRN